MNKSLFAEALHYLIIMVDPHAAKQKWSQARSYPKPAKDFTANWCGPLQCPRLSTDRASINQSNHKEIWERLCSKSHRDHKCTASKYVCPHYLSTLHFTLSVLWLQSFVVPSFSPSPLWSQTLPLMPNIVLIVRVLICAVTLKRPLFFWMTVPKFKWNPSTPHPLYITLQPLIPNPSTLIPHP